jgi:hypothetical protein
VESTWGRVRKCESVDLVELKTSTNIMAGSTPTDLTLHDDF